MALESILDLCIADVILSSYSEVGLSGDEKDYFGQINTARGNFFFHYQEKCKKNLYFLINDTEMTITSSDYEIIFLKEGTSTFLDWDKDKIQNLKKDILDKIIIKKKYLQTNHVLSEEIYFKPKHYLLGRIAYFLNSKAISVERKNFQIANRAYNDLRNKIRDKAKLKYKYGGEEYMHSIGVI
jgi:hypothetical protein